MESTTKFLDGFFALGTFDIIVRIILSTSVCVLFIAIILDFALHTNPKAVNVQKRSIVETGSMTIFFILFYFLLKSRVLNIEIEDSTISKVVTIMGTALVVFGCVGNVIGRFKLGNNWANQVVIYKSHTLVKTGIYKYVRHPLYATIMLMFLGSCLVFMSLTGFLAVLFVFIPFMYYRAKQEEKLLQERFSEYSDYKQKAGMFFPKLR